MLVKKFAIVTILTLLLTVFQSCRKLVEVGEPKTQITNGKVFQNEQSALAALSNIYGQLNNGSSINGNLTPYISLYADELTGSALNGSGLEFFSSALRTDNANILNIWKGFYSVIYQCNAVLEGLAGSQVISSEMSKQLSGEARFLRAFSYFYLVNLYGDVPLVTTTDVYKNSVASRTSTTQVYDQITDDLKVAMTLLKESYPTAEKVRANYWATAALLSRVYLYQSNWSEAEALASLLLNSNLYPLESCAGVFSRTSKETILQAWTPNGYTSQGALLNPASGTPTYFLRQELANSFEANDKRKASWTRLVNAGTNTYNLSSKYKKTVTASGSDGEYLIVLRSTEQYLIRAEARVMLDDLDGALTDLNTVRSRNGLTTITSPVSKDSCLILIEEERKKEFFTEWGHRFFDLKRWGKLDQEMSALKSTWKATAALLPVPQNEINRNPALLQNPGY